MTAAVPVYEKQVVFGSRRTRGGYFRIPPNREIRDAIVFIVLYYAARHRIRLYALVIMCNHIHWVGYDEEGRYPDFIRDIHMRISEVIMDHHGLEGRLWSGDRPRTPRLVGTELITLLYIITNAVKDGLVDVSTNWPGLIFSPENAGETVRAPCPKYLSDHYECFPPEMTYEVPIPHFYDPEMTIQDVRRDFRRRRRDHEATLLKQRNGKKALGAARALAVGPFDRPDDEPAHEAFRCYHATAEFERDCAVGLYNFRADYNAAVGDFNRGKRNVVWPCGTYARVRWHRCPCRAP